MNEPKLPIAVYYEHPLWFEPLFAELERRGTSYVRVDASHHRYDASETKSRYSLFFNRMSSSAYTRGNGQGIFYTRYYLAHLEFAGTPVVNGSRAFAIETSKALQLSLIASLGLAHPRTIIINSPEEAIPAAR
jgi:glutathione synthase/RimK-type ligase-like ATP-grasp enzyme